MLRPCGLLKAIAGTAGSFILIAVLFCFKQTGRLSDNLDAWIAASLALAVVFVLAQHILVMAWQALRRGIINVMVANYHIFSEWLSLIVKTRSSQAVRRLLALQPDTARVICDGVEKEVRVKQIAVGDWVRVRPGERIR